MREDMAKEFAKSFYKSKQWQACRNAYMQQVRGWCEDCMAKGIYTPAEIVHHIEHVTPLTIERPEVTMSFNNLRAVCRQCHAEEHGAKAKRYKIDKNGRIIV